jgi:hypothetical protein
MNRQAFMAAVLTLGAISYLDACQALGLSRRELTASLHVDSTEISVHATEVGYRAKIPFVYVNTTPGPVSKGGCGFPPFPELQKKVDGKWVAAYYPAYLLCLTKPDYSLPSGGTYRGVLDFFAAKPGHNTEPTLRVDSIDGVYRLEWDFVEGADTEVKKARTVRAISNEFRMISRQP